MREFILRISRGWWLSIITRGFILKMARTVNQENRLARRTEIVEAAYVCFVERGFHGTTMQDICSEAGLSPGVVYRHFASKDEIIQAIVVAEQDAYEDFIAELETTENLLELLAEAAEERIRESNKPGYVELTAEVSAEALRNPEARLVVLETEEAVRRALSRAIRSAITRGELSEAWNPNGLSDAIMALFEGLESKCSLNPKVSARILGQTAKQWLMSLRTPA